MALSCRKSLPWLAVALSACAAAAAPPPAAQVLPAPMSSEQPINLVAASTEVDYKSNTVTFADVVISQGPTKVQAEHAHATGLNFANSRWTFEGKVRIDVEQRGNLRSDQAVVDFKDNRIARATITGKPAEFEQKRADSEQMARGHANEIIYDLSDGTVRLSEDAWLSDGQNEISGPLLVYNIRAQRVQAATPPGTDERVHITITPPNSTGGGKPQPPKVSSGAAAEPAASPSAAAQPKPTPNPPP
ncbi:MAG TPA: lipopolysaccharide transport periplasmic protein LptA [Steroidobacteraceae bacterium]|nr:lipopolysaccharide transport periplasmic protein LptA [Steroidobacteraceae bacterium]